MSIEKILQSEASDWVRKRNISPQKDSINPSNFVHKGRFKYTIKCWNTFFILLLIICGTVFFIESLCHIFEARNYAFRWLILKKNHSPWFLFNWKSKKLACVPSNFKLTRCDVKFFRILRIQILLLRCCG